MEHPCQTSRLWSRKNKIIRNGEVQKEAVRRERNASKTENGARNGPRPKEPTKQNDGSQNDRAGLATERAGQPENKRPWWTKQKDKERDFGVGIVT